MLRCGCRLCLSHRFGCHDRFRLCLDHRFGDSVVGCKSGNGVERLVGSHRFCLYRTCELLISLITSIADGGTGSDYDLTQGSGTFIDGFEDQIIGHNIGDTFDVTVTFPEGYGDSTDAEGNTITLSGKEAVFSVTLNAITQSVVPTLTDEWVEAYFAASDDLHTADALRQYFDSALYANNLDNAAMDYLLTNSTFKEVPTQITSYYIRMFLNYHSQLATQYGMELDAYAQAKGYADADAMLADSDAYFEHLAKQDLVFQAIAEQLDITAQYAERLAAGCAGQGGGKRGAFLTVRRKTI